MGSRTLTDEQVAVVRHTPGKHARVLAVAGSGKTTTMVHRLLYLRDAFRVAPAEVLVLMFNRLAREQFQEKLEDEGGGEFGPRVHTFHSFAFGITRRLQASGLSARNTKVWTDDGFEAATYHIVKVIRDLEKKGEIPKNKIEAETAVEAISQWKGALIPPERAGHRSLPALARVYAAFERVRRKESAVTYDDFVPDAVRALEASPSAVEDLVGAPRFLIVDEYQDVNHGQQRLMELLAGSRADVMVVGDDDQTIYEWRGARPEYMREFGRVLRRKAYVDYTLSRSFRLGSLTAQCAANVIARNAVRVQKDLVPHDLRQTASILVWENSSEQPTDCTKAMVDELAALLNEGVAPVNIIVLGRLFAQLGGFEGELLTRKIPYRIIGPKPFFEREEVASLLRYLALGEAWSENWSDETQDAFLAVLNKPNRQIGRDRVAAELKRLGRGRVATGKVLLDLAESRALGLFPAQREALADLVRVIEAISTQLGSDAGDVVELIAAGTQYRDHFRDFHGEGINSEERIHTVDEFIRFATGLGIPARELRAFVATLDPTQGEPDTKKQVRLTSIMRTKGLEFDYVFLPECVEGLTPLLRENVVETFDTEEVVPDPQTSPVLETERRLFYVAVTRARKAAFIGTAIAPRKGQQGRSRAPAPSRFVRELALPETRAVLDAVTGDLSSLAGTKALRDSIRSAGDLPALERNLINSYLPRLGHTGLASELARLFEDARRVARPAQLPTPIPRKQVRPGGTPPPQSEPGAAEYFAWKIWKRSGKEAKGLETLRKAAEAGHKAATLELADVLDHGLFGVKADPERAKRLREQARRA
ncbi:MAG: ATP-dependent helicase [Thermoanaerobaculia bacterium]